MDDVDSIDAAAPEIRQTLVEIADRAAAKMTAENFPVALRVLPRRPRAHLARVYTYARFVDDVGDTAPGERTELLALIDAEVRALWSGRPATLAPVADLRALLDDRAVPSAPFLDLIEANRVDQRVSAYESFDDLLGYCELSAAPVGRIVLHIAGAASAANVADSDRVCAALQVLEHCQDVGEDARAGRIYLPAADLRAANLTVQDLLSATTTRALRGVIALQVERARGLLGCAPALVRRLPGWWSRFAVAGFAAGGLATADALTAARHRVLEGAVTPTKPRTAAHAARLLVGR
jgi:squalene synthase HpnC